MINGKGSDGVGPVLGALEPESYNAFNYAVFLLTGIYGFSCCIALQHGDSLGPGVIKGCGVLLLTPCSFIICLIICLSCDCFIVLYLMIHIVYMRLDAKNP